MSNILPLELHLFLSSTLQSNSNYDSPFKGVQKQQSNELNLSTEDWNWFAKLFTKLCDLIKHANRKQIQEMQRERTNSQSVVIENNIVEDEVEIKKQSIEAFKHLLSALKNVIEPLSSCPIMTVQELIGKADSNSFNCSFFSNPLNKTINNNNNNNELHELPQKKMLLFGKFTNSTSEPGLLRFEDETGSICCFIQNADPIVLSSESIVLLHNWNLIVDKKNMQHMRTKLQQTVNFVNWHSKLAFIEVKLYQMIKTSEQDDFVNISTTLDLYTPNSVNQVRSRLETPTKRRRLSPLDYISMQGKLIAISPIITLDKESYFFIELATSTIDKDSENEYTTIILFVEESCKWYFSFKLNQNYVVNHLKHAQIFGKELFTTTKYTEVGLRAELQPILSADNDDR